jgi:Cytochrome c, mono- and diheme variants
MAIVTASPALALDKGAVERGRLIVEANCAVCHAVGATGASPNSAAPPFRVLHLRYPIESLEEALAEGISTGHPEMPEFVATPKQIESIIAYVKSLETN